MSETGPEDQGDDAAEYPSSEQGSPELGSGHGAETNLRSEESGATGPGDTGSEDTGSRDTGSRDTEPGGTGALLGAPDGRMVSSDYPTQMAPVPDGLRARKAATSDHPDEADSKSEGSEAASSESPERPRISVRYFGHTDVGLVREHNEDNFMVVDLEREARGLADGEVQDIALGPRGLVLAVCDGMGGAAAGEVASQMAVDTVHELLQKGKPPRDRDEFARRIVYSIEEAGTRIFSAAKMDRSRRGMGTTATVAGLIDSTLFIGQVGDSRAYLLRGDKLSLITKDQSLVNQLIEAGQLTAEEAEAFEHSNIILQALGTTEEVSVDLTFLELRRGDRLLLCSDGLSGLVHDEVIQEVLAESGDLRAVAARLIELANAGGGHDNVTCVLADFSDEGLLQDTAMPAMYQQYPLPPDEEELDELTPASVGGGRRVNGRGSSSQYPAPGPSSKSPSRSLTGVLLAVLALALIVGAVVMAMRPSPKPELDTQEVVAEPEENASPEAQPVEVRVETDINGELYVDGQSYGVLEDGREMYLELLPGAYRIEARQDETVVASALLSVRPDVPATVSLRLPSGASAVPSDAGASAEPPKDAPTSAIARSPRTKAPSKTSPAAVSSRRHQGSKTTKSEPASAQGRRNETSKTSKPSPGAGARPPVERPSGLGNPRGAQSPRSPASNHRGETPKSPPPNPF